jgi:flagellar hook protein FlgE
MSSSLWIGTTGLQGSEKQLDVIANNLSNANTPGFKASDTYFNSMLSQNLAGGSQRVGQGVGVAAIPTIFDQGSFESTGNATDVAIDGNGFFILKDDEDNEFFSRAGGFNVNTDGYLVDAKGYMVQGHTFTEGVEGNLVESMNLSQVQSEPEPTTWFSLGVTLNSESTDGTSFTSPQVIYDVLGAEHTLSTTFTKTESALGNYWLVETTLDGVSGVQTYSGIKFDTMTGAVDKVLASWLTGLTATTAGDGTATAVVNNAEQLTKNTDAGGIVLTMGATADPWTITDNGGYDAMVLSYGDAGKDSIGIDLDGDGNDDITITLADTWATNDTVSFEIFRDLSGTDAADQTVTFADTQIGSSGELTWNLVDDDAETMTSFAKTSTNNQLNSDGHAPGDLTSLAVDRNGVIEGVFNNGQRQNLARLMLASFDDQQGLSKSGSYFIATNESGLAHKNKPATGGLGEIQSNSIEISNTDTGREFIKMIMAQRAYQASAKVITTADQLSQVLMNVKQ